MTPRHIGGIAVAGSLGILTGAAGAIVVRDATSPDTRFAGVMADHMGGAGMGSMMSGSMIGPGSFFGPGLMGGPAASSMRGGLHDLHHPPASPDGAN
jgi:hypothetical protein